MDDLKFVYVSYIGTTPEKLWDALISPEFTRQYWWGANLVTDWKVGSSLQCVSERGVDFEGQVLRYEPYSVISYSFLAAAQPGGEVEHTKVTYEIGTSGSLLKLTVTHDGFEPGSQLCPKVSNGWPAVISGLKSLLETGQPLQVFAPCSASA